MYLCPLDDTLWECDFKVKRPQKSEGILKLPPISEPKPIGEHLEATIVA